MSKFSNLVILGAYLLPLVSGQVVELCTDDACGNCPSSIATDGLGFPNCVVYDTETVFGGLGFTAGEDDTEFLYKAYPNIADPGAECNLHILSPASVEAAGCGVPVFETNGPTCDRDGTNFKETFLIQYCCGSGDCGVGGYPVKRGIAGHTARGSRSGSVYLNYPNGTRIEPKEVGYPKQKRACDGYQSYVPDGALYTKTGNSVLVSDTIASSDSDQMIMLTYSTEVSMTTSFSTSIGDPFGVISVSVGLEFTESTASETDYTFTVTAGQSGRVAWTPYYTCTSGEATDCDGGISDGEACTAMLQDDKPVGEYSVVDS